MKSDTPVWTTISGKRIPVPNMSSLHLLNTLKMLNKNPLNRDRQIYLDITNEIRKRRIKNDPNKLIKEIL